MIVANSEDQAYVDLLIANQEKQERSLRIHHARKNRQAQVSRIIGHAQGNRPNPQIARMMRIDMRLNNILKGIMD